MANTPRLGLPLMSDATEQQWATYSNAIKQIDALLNCLVQARQSAPPGSPSEGQCYIVTATATGAWVGQETKIAYYINSAWLFYTPAVGQIVWDIAADTYHRWDGTTWQDTLATSTFGGFHATTPTSMELIAYILFADTISLPADFVGSKGRVVELPTASYAMDMRKNDISIGTCTIATDGTFTFDTGGTQINLSPGDYITFVGNVTVDATLQGIAITLKGVR